MNEQRMPVSAIETPAVIVYMDVLESNIAHPFYGDHKLAILRRRSCAP